MIQPIASLRASTVRRRRAPRTARRGALVIAVIFFLLIGVLLGSLVLNWAHLIVVQRTLQGRADAIALAAAPALIDSGALTGWPLDSAADFSTAAIVADQYREANNEGGAASLRVAAADLHLSAGHLLNKLGQPDAANFITAAPYDLLRVDIERARAEGHPVQQLITGFWNLQGTDVTATAFAKIDNRLVGFRPTPTLVAPVVPLAIAREAWSQACIPDCNGNLLAEIEVRVACSSIGAATANGAFVGLNGPIATDELLQEIEEGLLPSDLPSPNHCLGPITAAWPQEVSGLTVLANPLGDRTAQALSSIAAAQGAGKRVFLLYDASHSQGSIFQLVGFVAGRVLRVDQTTEQIKLVIEPVTLVHTTAWIDDRVTETNPYVYKLSLLK